MNASTNRGGKRDFFKDVTAGETAAKEIYDYSAEILEGAPRMRHPEELPFAQNDAVGTLPGRAVTFYPMENDKESVRNGVRNDLSIAEVGRIVPAGAGRVDLAGEKLVFTPAAGFDGPVWFSYSLPR